MALSEDLYLVGNPLHDIIWGSMCCHLEFYDLEMKIVRVLSVSFNSFRITVNIYPSVYSIEYRDSEMC